ncbi:protein disulfide isomerase Mpd2p [Monosporozyma servazzii]
MKLLPIVSSVLTLNVVTFGWAKNTEILSIDDFNTIVNSNQLDDPHATSFNVIKYYTTWCSHCKRLTPIWSQLVKEYPDINFLSIDCDVFGGDLCKGLPGYPIVKVITTTQDDIIDLPDNKPVDKDSWLGYFKSWFNRDTQKLIHVEPERIIQYQGARNHEQISSFIEHLKKLDELQSKFVKIVYHNDLNLDNELLSSYFQDVLLTNGIASLRNEDNILVVSDHQSLAKERNKLENIIRNNNNDEASKESSKVKLQFINWLQDQIGNTETDSNQFKDEL